MAPVNLLLIVLMSLNITKKKKLIPLRTAGDDDCFLMQMNEIKTNFSGL